MKHTTFKKAGAAVLSMAMLLSFGAIATTSASAAQSSITGRNISVAPYTVYNTAGSNATTEVKNTDVTVYQVAYRDAQGNWKVNAPFGTQGGAFTDVVSDTDNATVIAKAVTYKTAVEDSNNAKDLAKVKVATGTTNGQKITLKNVNDGAQVTDRIGYYLIVPTKPSENPDDQSQAVLNPTLVQIDGRTDNETAESITLKTTDVYVDKTITGAQKGQYTDNSAYVAADSTVNYSIATILPTYADDVTATVLDRDFTITDTPDNTIEVEDIKKTNITVKINNVEVFGANTENPTVSVADNENGFKVTIPKSVVIANKGKNVEVTFKAKVKGNAKTIEANNNKAEIEYSNNFVTGKGEGKKDDTVPVYVGKLDLTKVDSQSENNKLKDAEFTLSVTPSDDDKTLFGTLGFTKVGETTTYAKTYQTNENGAFDFGHLPEGYTYTLTETTAPEGFKAITPVTFEVNAKTSGVYTTMSATNPNTTEVTVSMNKNTDNQDIIGNYNVYVKDSPADSLPGTGGMGTILFTVGGAAVVLLAGAMLVVYMRKRNVEE